jgi:hypothetical protein
MHSKVREWAHHPVSEVLLKILQEKKQQALDDSFNVPNDVSRDVLVRNIERVKVYSELLDLENLFLGEIEDERNI